MFVLELMNYLLINKIPNEIIQKILFEFGGLKHPISLHIRENIRFINKIRQINCSRIFYSGGWSLCYSNSNDINDYILNTRKINTIEISYADRPFIDKKKEEEVIVGLYPKDEIKTNKRIKLYINYNEKKYYFNPCKNPVNNLKKQLEIFEYLFKS